MADDEFLFPKSIGPGIGRRFARIGSGMAWYKEKAGNPPFGVEHNFRIQGHLFELARH